jgi:hypothetical protein
LKAFLNLLKVAIVLILLFSPAASGEGRQLFLNVYVDDTASEKALVVGNVEDISGLAFLNASEKIYENSGQIYAVCDSLVYNYGDGWRLSFPVSGYYEEYHAVFLVSGGFAFQEINCTEGLEFLSTSYNGAIVLGVQGFNLNDPVVNFSYVAL